MASNANILRVLENNQRRSSVHLDIEILPEKDKNKDTAIETTIEDVDKSPTFTGGMKRTRTGVNCSFMAFYGGRSPDRKRKKAKDSKDKSKMMTFKDPTEDPMYEAETTALSGITENIENRLVIELIDKFSPVIRNFPEQIKQEMLDLSAEWPNKREIFIGAINFVIHSRKDDNNNRKEELNEKCTERLCELLVREIENRMPQHCRKCKEYYTVKLNDCPELHCMWCRVGMHDCTEMNEMKDRPGILWLCETCEPIFNTHYLPKLDPIAGFEGFNSNLLPSKRSQVPAGEGEGDKGVETIPTFTIESPTQPQIVTVQSEFDNIEVVAEIHEQPSSTLASNNNNDNSNYANRSQVAPIVQPTDNTPTSGSMPPNYKDVKKFPNLNKNKICPFLTKGSCRYGAKGENQEGKCHKYHPNQCRAFNSNGTRDNGCKNGNKCSEWHATYICHSSANSKTCNRPECPFKHHKDCTVNRFDNFLENHNPHMMPRQYQGPDFPILHHRQSQHPHQRRYGPQINNRRQHSQFSRPPPQVPTDHLVHMIRTILREESNYQYQTRM